MTARDVPTLAIHPERHPLAARSGERARTWTGSPARLLGTTAGLALVYFGAGKLGLSVALVNPSASAVWPPTGLAIAALLLLGRAPWPGIFLGAFAVNATSTWTLASSLGIACGNTLEAVVAALLVEKLARGRRAFERSADVFRYAFLTAASTLISATVGVASLAASGHVPGGDHAAVWSTWWLGDLVSAWIVTPFLLEWCTRSERALERGRLLELVLFTATLLTVVLLTFFAEPIAAGTHRNPFTFLYLPPLIWAAFRFPRRIVATATLLFTAGAVLGTLGGRGPFTSLDQNTTLLLLQLFVGVVAVTALAVCATVSESRRASEELQRRSLELRRSNEELEQFATVASHDLQEPLRVATGYLQLLERRSREKLSPEEHGYVQRAVDSAGRMRALIDGLLAYARLDSGPAFGPVDCERVLERALADLREAMLESGATLERAALPVVHGDESQLVQLFRNLIGNALKFRKPDAPARIRVDSRAQDGQWVLAIQDEGIGIEPAAFERIFLLFQRLHHQDEIAGTGLGLAICKKIVERHGGRIWVESRPQVGSRFSFTIPVAGATARRD